MFIRPAKTVANQRVFNDRETGINHPDNNAFIKIADSGDIEIMAAEGLGLIMHPHNRSITLIANHVNFITKEGDGLRWNKLSFNNQATKFTEPAFVPYDEDEVLNLYRGADHYFGD